MVVAGRPLGECALPYRITLYPISFSTGSGCIWAVLISSLPSHELEFTSDLGVTDVLELPPAFGNIYLGEKFTSYLSINNDSQTAVSDVAFKAELQTTSQRSARLRDILPSV